jgi:surface carbohydrate biosynthesis protein
VRDAVGRLIFVPIETKVREFHGKLLFALLAAERGFACVLGEQQALRRALPYLDHGLYIDKSVPDTRKEWFRQCRGLGNRLAAWDEEGLVFFDRRSYRELRLCPEAFELIDGFFAWGGEQAAAIRESGTVDGGKVRVTGNPRFDLLRPELRPFFDGPVRELKRRHGRIILVNTGFALANHFQDMAIVRRQFVRYPMYRTPGVLDAFIDSQRAAFAAFKRLLPRLAAEFPGHTVLVRPHPSENRDTWRELARGLANVVVNAEGNVVEWILASEVVLHSSCTTGIESFYLDVPAVGWRNGPGDRFEQPLPNALSLNAYTDAEALGHVHAAVASPGGNPLRRDAAACRTAAENVDAMDGPLACDRILDGLGALDCRRRRRPLAAKLDRRARDAAADLRKFIETGGREDRSYARQKFPGLSLPEVQEARSRLSAVTGRFGGVRVSPVRDGCFLVERAC